MTLQDLINRVRVYTRDFTGSIFREADIDIFLKESFNRCKVIPELSTLTYPNGKSVEIALIPESHQYLLSLYASSRCLFQDEQDYRAGTLMNEFENKLEELHSLVECGQIVIKDANGIAVSSPLFNGFVVNEYFDVVIPDDEAIFMGGD